VCMMRCSAFITGAATPQGNRLVAKYYGDDMATEEQQVSHSSTSYTIRGSAAQPRSHCRSSQFAFEKLLFSKTSRIQAARQDSELTLPDLSLRRLWLWRVPLRRRHSDEPHSHPFRSGHHHAGLVGCSLPFYLGLYVLRVWKGVSSSNPMLAQHCAGQRSHTAACDRSTTTSCCTSLYSTRSSRCLGNFSAMG
jgi:hypothetical protein